MVMPNDDTNNEFISFMDRISRKQQEIAPHDEPPCLQINNDYIERIRQSEAKERAKEKPYEADKYKGTITEKVMGGTFKHQSGLPLFRNVKDAPKREYICKRLRLERKTVNLVTGTGESGKSLLLQYLASCMITEKDFFGFPITGGNVLHIDYEQPENLTFTRYNRILTGLVSPCKVEEFEAKYTIDRISPIKKLDENGGIEPLTQGAILDNNVKLLVEVCVSCGAKAIIIDSLRAVSCANENDSEIERIVGMFRRVADAADVCVLLIHHKGKKNDPTQKQNPRGSSAIFDAADTQIDINWNQDKNEYTIENRKMRNGIRFAPMVYTMKDEGEFCPDQDTTEQLCFNLINEKVNSATEKEIEILSILELSQFEISKSSLLEKLSGSQNGNSAKVKDMIELGYIACTIGKRNSQILSLSDNGRSFLKELMTRQ